MRLLVLGGTVFLGRYLVERALAHGHEVTLFNRGRTNPDLFDGETRVEKLHGDRREDLSLLAGRRWDAVFDTSGYFPQHVEASAVALSDAVDLYVFISTLNVYADLRPADIGEEAPLVDTAPYREAEPVAEAYGPLKALCEEALLTALPGRALIVRPGLLVGAWDRSQRFAYWVDRLARGGEVLAPGRPGRQVQCLHAGDLADWLIRMAEARQTGIYNAAGPEMPLSMGEVLAACHEATGSEAEFTWVDEDFLFEREVAPWIELPLWLPESTAGTLDNHKAVAAGLTCRPIRDIAADTRDALARADVFWPATAQWSGDTKREVGLSAEKEEALLREWHETLREPAPLTPPRS